MNNSFQQTILDIPCVGESVNNGVTIVTTFTPSGCRETITVVIPPNAESSIIPSVFGISRQGISLATQLPTGQVQVQTLNDAATGDTIQRDTSTADGFLLAALFFVFLLLFFTIQRFMKRRQS